MEASNVKKETLIFEELQCANCANKIEAEVEELSEVKSAKMNFSMKRLEIEATGDLERLVQDISEIAHDIEPGTIVKRKNNQSNKRELKLEGLSCANCANKIEDNVKQLANVEQAHLNFSSKKLTVKVEEEGLSEKIIAETKEIINDLEPDVIVKEETEEALHEDTSAFNDTMKKESGRLLSGALFFALALLLDLSFTGELMLYGMAYLIVGYKVLTKAVKDMFKGQLFDENFLMTIATIGAFAIGEFPEGVAVMLFYEVGELFQDLAVNRSRNSIQKLMDIRPDIANLKEDGELRQVDPNQLQIGDTIVVKAGEKVPVDGQVIDGEAMVDTAALTGESVPRKVEEGEEILSGSINQDGLLTVRVEKEFKDSTVSKILDLVENAASEKAPTENFITKFARYYTPAVVFGALGLAFIPPLLISGAVLSDWIYRALIFLVVSCPCALVVSIPLGFFGGIGSASKKGILIKGGNYLEALNELDTVVFDKTGTLTEGVFDVQTVVPATGWTEEELLEAAAVVEYNSNHPIAQSILEAYQGPAIEQKTISDYQEIAGKGLSARSDEQEILAGNHKLMEANGINYQAADEVGTIIYIAVDGNYAGYIAIDDKIKSDSKSALQNLKDLGIERVVMLTGDNEQVAQRVAEELGVDNYYAGLLPDEKVDKMEEILEENQDGKSAFVGDGINDAPVLARSDIGVAMGGLGSDAAIEAADIVLMKDKPSNLTEAVKVAHFTRKIVWQNIVLALGVKGLVLLLGAFGMATMWEAVFADVGVALLAVLNAIRIIKK
ncbi:heavy metal translocating P-type ATPase [Halanaerobacter jeridensis]|uniref:Cd2+/Zn2+-exporting ATPase n=1 Tax=Halanaerobacter jeridensis TaxID=706427 RepID=A0A938XQJ9_9FIRM|nr:heavy metal translocating P-type ATPase [Halanaerobacter jeridensis]MBM7558043.1 Cd2+/Zn2+-exporting ATPase [Halanaerobacter jeridensis]